MSELEKKETEVETVTEESPIDEIESAPVEEKKKNSTKEKKQKNKNKNSKDAEQKSRILEYLKSEHKWENYVLLFLSLFALVLGCLIINETLTVNSDFPIIGDFPKVFAWILIGLSAFALILSMYPFFKPAFPEFKKIKWPRPKAFLADTARVFIFLIILVLLFLLYDAFISKLMGLLLNR
ncbi:MAG: preprotein translocase subunit SecE [Anaeroplasmataceae bacterium]